MARYNTTNLVTTATGAVTLTAPNESIVTKLTGTAPYTVTVPNPMMYLGAGAHFFNASTGTVTLSTPSGVFQGAPNVASGGVTQTLVQNGSINLYSDGTNWLVMGTTNGPDNRSSGTFTNNVGISGTLTVSGSSVTASSSFTPTNTYDLMTKTFVETKYGKPWLVQSSSTTASAGDRLFADTGSAPITITLPASPTLGDEIRFIDFARTFSVRNLTIGNNGNRIMGQLDSMTVSTSGAAFGLVWSGATNGWLVDSGI